MRASLGLTALLLLSLASLNPGPVHAGVYGDDLAKCLVERTSDGDKVLLAQWIFTVISVHPSAASLGEVSDADRAKVAKQAGKVFETLLTDSCKEQTVKAVKYEGADTLGSSFKVLGEIAMTTLLADQNVAAESQNFIKYVDEAKIKAALSGTSGD
ncbi:hypothetical protein N800_08885 [Lysobacter daejeonensis GH1-9]|uniref:Uncharacterized protein n=1 Tax=Lysobacter daejeonensis GH1-9 TaxID=1385517 RepID=A0A0A0F169_9GAMM|nr:hypothetical protein [Lysobacter daejeonensis]KGM56300.1 hypothetical protein N800_08885 [Lysobacter daejeonensis GH1-9]